MPTPSSLGEPAPRRLARDRAYEAIKDAILKGVVVPGERLDHVELQQWLGMSKTPIRQALDVLTREGFVETAAQSYTRVVFPRAEDAVLHLQTSGVIVLGILELTIPHTTAPEREDLAALLESVVESLRTTDAEGATVHAQEYLSRLMDLCPNRPLIRLSKGTLDAHTYYVVTAYRSLNIDWPVAIAGYKALADAMRTGDLEAIEAASKPLFRLD